MVEIQRYVGRDRVIDSSSVVLGPDDDGSFRIVYSGLVFDIHIFQDLKAPAIDPQRVSRSQMDIKINTANQVPNIFKFKAASVQYEDIYLAIHVDQVQNYYVVAYTLSARKQ
jgi:hypothetical protein